MQTQRIGRLGDFAIVMLAILTLRIVYWQMLRADELNPLSANTLLTAGGMLGGTDDELNQRAYELMSDGGVNLNLESLPQPLVQRTRELLNNITRGSIYDRSGRLLVQDQQITVGERSRIYTDPAMAHVTGYVTGLRLGITGVERSHNAFLLGLHRIDTQIDQTLHTPIQGSDLILTIDSNVQQVAINALGGRRGAIVVLDGNDGAVLAMVSSPTFDPNRMFDSEYAAGLLAECSGPNCPAPLLNRSTQALFVPGSTWKTVPLVAGLDTGQLQPGMIFDFGRARQGPDGPYYVYEVDGGTIPDPNHREARLSLELSYAKSANAAFARIGDEMGAATLLDYAHRLGFGPQTAINFEIPQAETQVANDEAELVENNLLRASTAIGQGELLVTPLSMARMVLPILNSGDMPLPYLVDGIRDPDGGLRAGLVKGNVLRNLFRPETAQEVKRMMRIVVEQGYGSQAAVRGLTVGGKTGTAQLGSGLPPHAWFIGFAESGDQSVAIAVLVENGGEGSQVAAPIFAQVAEPALLASSRPVQIPALPTPLPPEPTDLPPVTPQAGLPPTQPAVTPGTTEATPAARPVPLEPDILYREGGNPFFNRVSASCPERAEGVVGTGEFGWPSTYQYRSGGGFREGHAGIDFGAPLGSRIYAADSGVVIFAGWTSTGYGNTVVIDHGNGFYTLYAHLSQVSTRCGAAVERGDRIGMSGDTGNSGGPHLHFEVRVETGYIDPLRVLPTP